jgi:hypothetical protein
MLHFSPRTRHIGIALVVGILAAGIFGCSSAQLVNVWKNPEQPTATLTNMLVITMKRDAAIRRLWEDSFVNALRVHGVSATPSYELFPTELPDTQQVVAAVHDNGYDGVIITTRLPHKTTSQYMPGYITQVPVYGYDPWYNTYSMYYRDVYQPGYFATDTIIRYRTDVMDTKDKGELVWTATSEVIDPTSSQAVDHEITEMIIPELAKQGVIPRKK